MVIEAVELGPSFRLKILLQGFFRIPHSYALVMCMKAIHLYKLGLVDLYAEETEYASPVWKASAMTFPKDYVEIVENLLHRVKPERYDIVYRCSYPYNVGRPSNADAAVVFYTAEFSKLDKGYFRKGPGMGSPGFASDVELRDYLSASADWLYVTGPSDWSCQGFNGLFPPSSGVPILNTCITHGVDTMIFNRTVSAEKRESLRRGFGFKDTDVVMGNYGALTGNKGILQLLLALHQLNYGLPEPRYRLLLKGTGTLYNVSSLVANYLSALQQVMSEEQMKEFLKTVTIVDLTVRWFEDNPRDVTMKDLYQCCDLYVSPYIAEGFNLTPLEAIASGTTVVISSTGSATEYVNALKPFASVVEIPATVESTSNGLQNRVEVEDIVRAVRQAEGLRRPSNPRALDAVMDTYYSWYIVAEKLYDLFRIVKTNHDETIYPVQTPYSNGLDGV